MAGLVLMTNSGALVTMERFDPCFDTLDNVRVRIDKVHADGMVQVMDNDGVKVLPDLRHPSQLTPFC